MIHDWRAWLRCTFPTYVVRPFAQRHVDLWEWVEALKPGLRPRPFVAIWPRGGAKSTTAELASVRVGYNRTRRYIWYISSTQDKADKHVETIASLLESAELEKIDPELTSRKLSKYGHSRGWRRSRLRTGSGLTIDALGLDVGARGAKVEDARPDLMIFDDVDEKHDTPTTTQKKIETITASLLPAGSSDLAVMFIQNMIHPNSIAAQLSDNRAQFMADRIVSGPHPAIEGLTYEVRYDEEQKRNRYTITGGAATWEGQDIAICEQQINTWGPTAFLEEAQHEVERTGGIWDHIEFRHCKFENMPALLRGCVWCDPAVTATDKSCSNGIIADGIDRDGVMYRVFMWEGIDTPLNILKRSIRKALELGFGYVGVETNQGGDLWRDEYRTSLEEVKKELKTTLDEQKYKTIRWPDFREEKAGAGTGGKVERNQRMLVDYERGSVVHVEGTHEVLERALRRFPLEPLDLADAAYWGWNDLRGNYVTVVRDPFADW